MGLWRYFGSVQNWWLLPSFISWAVLHQWFDYWALHPSVVWLSGFTPLVVCLKGVILIKILTHFHQPIEDCRVFVLWLRATSYFTCPICNALIVILLFLVDFSMFYIFYMKMLIYVIYWCLLFYYMIILLFNRNE